MGRGHQTSQSNGHRDSMIKSAQWADSMERNIEDMDIKRAGINSYHFPVLVGSTPSQLAPPCVQGEHASKVSQGFHPQESDYFEAIWIQSPENGSVLCFKHHLEVLFLQAQLTDSPF